MKNDTKNYAVTLKIYIAGYEKHSTHVVRDTDSVEDAVERAIRNESHDRDDDTPPDACGWYDDVDGEISYQVRKVVEIDDGIADTLERFI